MKKEKSKQNSIVDKEVYEKPNEDIELARQSGYNEACFVFEKKVKKLKEEINNLKVRPVLDRYDKRTIVNICAFLEVEIDKIMGFCTTKVSIKDNHSPQASDRVEISNDKVDLTSEDTHAKEKRGCGNYFKNNTGRFKDKPDLICGWKYRVNGKRYLCPKCEVRK